MKHISEVIEIFDGGSEIGYSLAVVRWDGVNRIGIRWNVTENEWSDDQKSSGKVICIGEPNSRGYSTWFILPENFISAIMEGDGTIKDALKKAISEHGIK